MTSFRLASVALYVVSVAACTTDTAKPADTVAAIDTAMGPTAMTGDTMPAAGPPASSSGMMDPNSASAGDLAAIPGVTAAIASAVTAGRPYANMVALDKVLATTLTEEQRDTAFARLWVPIDLNTATDAEILLIPGIGSRMLREFKEYRPYTSMEQFRREIGKYVDAAEVARLERYVMIR